MSRPLTIVGMVALLLGATTPSPAAQAQGAQGQSGCDVEIPASDASAPAIRMTLQLPDGTVIEPTHDPSTREVTLPSNSDVTVRVSAEDPQGAQNVQLWLATEVCQFSGDMASCSGPGLQGRPAIENPDASRPGQTGCRERWVEWKVRVRRSASSRTSIQASVTGQNFSRRKANSALYWLRPGPGMAPSLAHDSHGLQPGQGLNKNTFIASPGGCFQLWMQNDGNVVLYSFGRAIWSTGTDQSGGAYLVMQGDGNLVVYDGWGTPVWWSGTQGHAGAALFLQQDGNIVIYHGNAAVWASRTVTACVDPRCLNTCLDACAADFQDCLATGPSKAACVQIQRLCRSECSEGCRR